MGDQTRLAATGTRTVWVTITDGDRIRALKSLPISDGWKELLAMREEGRSFEDLLNRAARMRPGLEMHEVVDGIAKLYAALETALHDLANRRARLL